MPKRITHKDIPDTFNASFTEDDVVLDVKAAESDTKKPTFSLVANTGKPMMLGGFFDPVVIDLAGAKFARKKTPILMDHDTSKRVGHSTSQSIEDGKIKVDGVVSSSMGVAQGFVSDAKDGFPFQVSVGATILDGEFIEDGEKVQVNGRNMKGPLIVARKTKIREVSVTVLGADGDTSAKVAASRKSGKDKDMTFAEFVASMGFEESNLSDAQRSNLENHFKLHVQASDPPTPSSPKKDPVDPPNDPSPDFTKSRKLVAQEEERVDSIRILATQYSDVKKVSVGDKEFTLPQIKAHAITENWTPDQLELQLIRAERPTPSGPAIHVPQQVKDLDEKVISAAIVKASGKVPASQVHDWSGQKWGYEHMYEDKVLEASDHKEIRNISLHQIMDLAITAATGHTFSGNRKSSEFIHATRDAMRTLQASSGVTTLQVTNVFDDAANKMLLAGYQSLNTTWQEWCGTKSVSDFKTHNMYRLTMKGGYEPIGADGELKHGGFVDSKYQVSADTYGKIVGLTRKHLINDDLEAFSTIMSMLGIEGAKSIEEVAYVLLLTQVGTTWTSGNKNLGTGAGSDLTIAGLTASAKLFEDQVDDDNSPLMIEPDRILVGTQDRVEAGQLFNDTEVRRQPGNTGTKRESVRNPHVSAFRPIVSPFLNNTNIKRRVQSIGSALPNQDTDQWWMFPNPNIPQGSTITAAFLNGNRTPFLESDDASFNVLGLQWRAYHDFGFGVGDPKLSVRNPGA